MSPFSFRSFHTSLEHLLRAKFSASTSLLPLQIRLALAHWEDKRQGWTPGVMVKEEGLFGLRAAVQGRTIPDRGGRLCKGPVVGESSLSRGT